MAKAKISKPRYHSVDVMRSLAVVSMVLYHSIFYANWQNIITVSLNSFEFRLWQQITLTLFLVISGISSGISETYSNQWLPKQRKRLIVFATIAAIINIATLITVPSAPVYFGVIHCLAVAQLFFLLRVQSRWWLLTAIVILTLYTALPASSTISWLLPFGVTPTVFSSIDYVPLLPWLAAVFIGKSLGLIIANTAIPSTSTSIVTLIITWPGRHALSIYLLHLPIIAGIIFLIF